MRARSISFVASVVFAAIALTGCDKSPPAHFTVDAKYMGPVTAAPPRLGRATCDLTKNADKSCGLYWDGLEYMLTIRQFPNDPTKFVLQQGLYPKVDATWQQLQQGIQVGGTFVQAHT